MKRNASRVKYDYQDKRFSLSEIINKLLYVGKLKRKVKLNNKTFFADIVTTDDEKKKCFDMFHNSNMGGHGGAIKTRYKIAEKYYWPGLAKDVERWVSFQHMP